MFWKQARRKYAGVTADDPDIRRFHELSHAFQQAVYGGLGGWVHDVGHRWIAAQTGLGRVLEIGFGAGRHARFFAGDRESYIASEYSGVHVGSEAWREMRGRCLRCDARSLPFRDAVFDSVVSVYNLEHIDDLQAVFREIYRVLKRRGALLIGLPCEGGFAWNLGRELTTRRILGKRYGVNYDKIIAYEHVHSFPEVVAALRGFGKFEIVRSRYIPFGIACPQVNLIACLLCVRSNG